MKKKTKTTKIDKTMPFSEIMLKHPESAEVLLERGMHCMGCPMAMNETLEQGALMHGINPDELVNEINKKAEKKKIKKAKGKKKK